MGFFWGEGAGVEVFLGLLSFFCELRSVIIISPLSLSERSGEWDNIQIHYLQKHVENKRPKRRQLILFAWMKS